MKFLIGLALILTGFLANAKEVCSPVGKSTDDNSDDIRYILNYLPEEFSGQFFVSPQLHLENKQSVLKVFNIKNLKSISFPLPELGETWRNPIIIEGNTAIVYGRHTINTNKPETYDTFVWIYKFNPEKQRLDVVHKQDVGMSRVAVAVGEKSKRVFVLRGDNSGFSVDEIVPGEKKMVNIAWGGPSNPETNHWGISTEYSIDITSDESELRIMGRSNWIPNNVNYVIRFDKNGKIIDKRHVSPFKLNCSDPDACGFKVTPKYSLSETIPTVLTDLKSGMQYEIPENFKKIYPHISINTKIRTIVYSDKARNTFWSCQY